MIGQTRHNSLADRAEAPSGRPDAMPVGARHQVSGAPLKPPFPSGLAELVLGMGCFWGAERLFWQTPGVYTTAVGYAGGATPNPTYQEVCSGRTGHAEVVRVVYDPGQVSLDQLLRIFWEEHDPTQGMRQGNDQGTQYRSVLYLPDATAEATALASREHMAERLAAAGFGPVTTEVERLGPFYYAEDEHQQYLHKNPAGYCGLRGTGVTC